MNKFTVLFALLVSMLAASCGSSSGESSPIAGLANAISARADFLKKDRTTDWEEYEAMSIEAVRADLARREEIKNALDAKIEEEAAKLDGATIALANDDITEIEPLRLTLVKNGTAPIFRLNGKFRIEKDIALDVWNDWHEERLKNGSMARVDLASPKVEVEGVLDQFTYSLLALVSVIPVSVEGDRIVAKAGTIIDIVNAEWDFRTEDSYADIYKNASKIWLQPTGIVAERRSDGRID